MGGARGGKEGRATGLRSRGGFGASGLASECQGGMGPVAAAGRAAFARQGGEPAPGIGEVFAVRSALLGLSPARSGNCPCLRSARGGAGLRGAAGVGVSLCCSSSLVDRSAPFPAHAPGRRLFGGREPGASPLASLRSANRAWRGGGKRVSRGRKGADAGRMGHDLGLGSSSRFGPKGSGGGADGPRGEGASVCSPAGEPCFARSAAGGETEGSGSLGEGCSQDRLGRSGGPSRRPEGGASRGGGDARVAPGRGEFPAKAKRTPPLGRFTEAADPGRSGRDGMASLREHGIGSL